MRRMITGLAVAGALATAVAGPVAARPAATYEVVMTQVGCDFTFTSSWKGVKVEQTQLGFLQPVSYQGLFFGATSHGNGAFKNYGNNQVIDLPRTPSTELLTMQFQVYFYDSIGTLLNTWTSDALEVPCT
jgi:hypothetical protein